MNGGVGAYIEQASSWADEERGPGRRSSGRGCSTIRTASQTRRGRDHRCDARLPSCVTTTPHGSITSKSRCRSLRLPSLVLSRDAFRPGWPRAVPKIATVALLGLFLDAGFLRSPLEARLADPSVPHAILIAWLAAALPQLLVSRRSWRPVLQAWAVPVRALVVVATIPFVFVQGSTFSNGLYDRLDDGYLVEGPRQTVARVRSLSQALRDQWDLSTWIDQPDRPDLMTLALYLNACTPPNARIFVQPYLPHALALARRGFAAGHGDLPTWFF